MGDCVFSVPFFFQSVRFRFAGKMKEENHEQSKQTEEARHYADRFRHADVHADRLRRQQDRSCG